MQKHEQILTDEELKQFFLNEALLLCPTTRLEKTEKDQLLILYGTLRKTRELLGTLNHSSLETHHLDVCQVFAFYFVELQGNKKEKHRMSRCLKQYGSFLLQLIKMKDLNSHYYFYLQEHLKALVRLLMAEYPNDFPNGLCGMEETLLEGTEKV